MFQGWRATLQTLLGRFNSYPSRFVHHETSTKRKVVVKELPFQHLTCLECRSVFPASWLGKPDGAIRQGCRVWCSGKCHAVSCSKETDMRRMPFIHGQAIMRFSWRRKLKYPSTFVSENGVVTKRNGGSFVYWFAKNWWNDFQCRLATKQSTLVEVLFLSVDKFIDITLILYILLTCSVNYHNWIL